MVGRCLYDGAGGETLKQIGPILVLLAFGVTALPFLRACSSDEEKITTAKEAAPPDEKSFLLAVSDYGGSKFIDSKPLEALPLRRQRAAAICAAVPHGVVSNWVGRVEEVSATNHGDAILRLYLYGDGTVFLENWNEKTNANEDKFPVPEGSPIYTEISKLDTNELVRISGSFQPDQSDCFRTVGSETADETGNLAATMMSPTFIFRWDNVSPLKN
jgi:hypothetical protein